jgi:hypothetical protein
LLLYNSISFIIYQILEYVEYKIVPLQFCSADHSLLESSDSQPPCNQDKNHTMHCIKNYYSNP